MGKLLKIIGWLAATLVILVIALLAAVTLFFDPNDFKQELSSRVQEYTGRELVIGGDISLSYFPWLGVELGDVSLGNAAGFGTQPIVSIKSANIRVKLRPLFERRLEMDTLVLQGLTLDLRRDRTGKTNWDDLMAAIGRRPDSPVEDEAELTQLAALALGGIDIQDARVVWDDHRDEVRYAFSRLNLKTGPLAPGAPFDLDMDFDVDSKAPAVSGHVELQGEVAANPFAGTYELRDAELQLRLQGDDLPVQPLDARLKSRIEADLIRQTLSLDDLTLEVFDMRMTGSALANRILTAPDFSATLAVAPFNPRNTLQAFGQRPPATADRRVLKSAEAKLQIEATPDRLWVRKLSAKLDDMTIYGSLSIRNPERPIFGFSLVIDSLDLDRYLPAAAPAARPAVAASAGKSAAAAPSGGATLPVESLRALTLAGKLRIGALKLNQLRSSNVQATIKTANGLINLDPLSAQLYEGEYRGRISLDARKRPGDVVRLTANKTLTGIRIGPLLRDLTGEERLSGSGNFKVRVTASGASPDAMKQTLNGSGTFAFRDGAVKGVNIARVIREAYAKYKGRPIPPGKEVEQTDFSELAGSFTITNGILKNRDLAGRSPLLRVRGDGKVDLVRERMDYILTAHIVGTLEGQGGRQLGELKNVPLPVRVRGPFSELSYSLDLGRLIEDKAKAKVKKKKQEIEKKVKKKLRDKLREILR